MLLSDFFLLISSYILGSIPFSQMIAHRYAGVNLREVGEGNVGSRNVFYMVGPLWGLIAGVLDVSKGFLCCAMCIALNASPILIGLAGICVVLGHQFPIFLHGHGGKGVASAAGFWLGLSPFTTSLAGILMAITMVVLHDFNHALVVGIVSVIILPAFFVKPLWITAIILLLALLLLMKKLYDRQHEAAVWAAHPWKNSETPGWVAVPPHEEIHSPADMS
jgi:glycerol-3-phosphate acyltransferase PlsY